MKIRPVWNREDVGCWSDATRLGDKHDIFEIDEGLWEEYNETLAKLEELSGKIGQVLAKQVKEKDKTNLHGTIRFYLGL